MITFYTTLTNSLIVRKRLFLVNKNENELRNSQSSELTKLSYDEFMEIMLQNIAKNRKKQEGIIFESETSHITCFFCPFNKKDDDAASVYN